MGVAEFFALLYIAYEVVSIFKNMAFMRAARKKGMGKGAGVSGEVYGRTAGHRRTGRGQHHSNVEEHRTQER